MSNMSVVVNYKDAAIFATDEDRGYVQFTRSGDRVYISVDGKSVGCVPAAEFARVQKLFVPAEDEIIVPRDLKEYALRHGYGR